MLQLSVRELAREFGVSPQTMGRRLKDSNIKVARGKKFTVKTGHDCLVRNIDVNEATSRARLDNLEADAELKRLELRQLEKDLVALDEAVELVMKPWIPVAQMIKDMPARLATACNPSDPILARETLEEYCRDLCKKIEVACTKLLN
jgi:transposase-like protein